MISSFFNTTIFQPLYNGLIFLIHLVPFADAGVIVIVFTGIIKLILLPLSLKASRAQLQMKSIEKDLNLIKEKYKDNKEEQAQKTIEYYKEKGINPFASIFILIVQLPIIIGLYQVFLKSGLPTINKSLLYSFVPAPEFVNMTFIHLINITQKSLVLAVIAGITTFVQLHLASSGNTPPAPTTSMQNNITQNMATQMKYFFPIIVTFISYSISGVLALYWITSNLFAIGQEMYIKHKYHKTPIVV